MKYQLFDADYIDACKGDFPLVYVALHPFFWLDPSKPYPNPNTCPYPEDNHYEFNNHIKRHAQQVSWKTVADLAEFQNVRDVYHAMSSWKLGLRGKFCAPQLMVKLKLTVEQNDLWAPEEDILCPMLELKLGQLFEALQKASVFLHNDVMEKTKIIDTSDFLNSETCAQEHHGHYATHVYPADMSVVTASFVDRAHTIICLKQDVADKVGIAALFEGFWATPSTNAGWWQDGQWSDICADPRNRELV